MAETIRLNKVLRELNISIDRAVDFLETKGIEVEKRPTTKISSEVYQVLSDEFETDANKKVASKEVSEAKLKEKEALRVEREKEIEAKLQKEEAAKVEVVKAKSTLEGPKQVGKIDLDTKKQKVEPSADATPPQEKENTEEVKEPTEKEVSVTDSNSDESKVVEEVNASKGEFGISYQLRRPVSELINERLPATIELVVISALIALISGTLLGVYTGINRKSFVSDIILAVSLLGVSLPTFVIGILFIYLFAVILGILPSFGRGEVVDLGFWTTGFLSISGWKAIILPSVTLSLFQMTYIIRLVRAEMMEILQTDYIKFARARGISENSIKYKHALKNGLIPVITIAGINIGTLIAFSIITETVFQWPGMGFLFIQAVQFVDIPIMSAYLVFIAFVFVMINFIVDILYYFIDPRIRVKGDVSSG